MPQYLTESARVVPMSADGFTNVEQTRVLGADEQRRWEEGADKVLATNREAEGDYAKKFAATRFAELAADTEACFPDWTKDVTDAAKSQWTTVYTSSTGVRMILEQTVADERLTRSMEIWPN